MLSRNSTGNTLQDVRRTLSRHWRQSVTFFLVVVTGVALFTLLSPKEYRSEGKLFVRLGRENATLDQTVTLSQTPIVAIPQSRENEINSVVEILESRALLEKIVDGLGPAVVLNSVEPGNSSDNATDEQAGGWIRQAGVQFGEVVARAKGLLSQFGSNAGLDDRERAILLLAKNLKIEAAKKSSVIQVSYQGPTPTQCQSVVAKLIDAYLDEHLRLNRARGSHQFFADQTNRLREELSHKEIELRDLKNQTGLASPVAQRQLLVARIGRLEDDLLSAESARAVAEAKVRDLREKLTSLPDSQVTIETTGFANEGTDRMREQFYALQVREKEAQAKYTEDHPKMVLIRDQIATARSVLDEEERGRKQVTKEPGRLHHQAQVALLGEEPALASLQSHAKKLQTQLAELHKELATLNENEMRFATLQREVDLLEADYRKYSTNLEQARIDQQLDVQRMSNIGIVQPASFEPRPVRPRKLLNLLLGMGVGLFGALALPLALEQLGSSPTAAEPVTRRSQTPIVARVPQMSSRPLTGHTRRVPR